MDRKLVLDVQFALPAGHRVEVQEHLVEGTGRATVLEVLDLDTRIRMRRAERVPGEILRWSGRVRDCTIRFGAGGVQTIVSIDAEDGPAARAGASAAATALEGADAAAEAAKTEADRWGGGDRIPEPEPERFW